jgi:hypothetical protein
MDDEPEVEVHASREKIVIFRFLKAMKLKAGVSRVHLEVESSGFDSLLFFGSEAPEAIGKGVGYSEFNADSDGDRD